MSLITVGAPDNVKIAGVNPRALKLVESDVYNIAQRVKEIDRNLYIVVHEGHERPFVVMEHALDGAERMVSRYAELTPAILEDLRYMLAVPFEKRFAELTKKIDAENEANENAWMESEKHDRFTWEFRKALEESNMTDFMWTRVYMNGGRKKRG